MVMSRELDLNSNKRFGDKKRKLEMVVETAQKIWGNSFYVLLCLWF